MKIKFNDIAQASELESILKRYLMIGNATSAHVQAFLQTQDLTCSQPIRRSEGMGEGISSYWRFIKEDCDSYRFCNLQVKLRWTKFDRKGHWPWQWVLNWLFDNTDCLDHMLLFSFRSDILADIKVITNYTGL